MKKSYLFLGIFLLISNFAWAQKLGYIDSEFILEKIPEYAEAQEEIKKLAEEWYKEVRSLHNDAEVMRAKLRSEDVLLNKVMKEERQAEIDKKVQEAIDKNTELFGVEGLYWKKKNELLKPVRTKLEEAAKVVAEKEKIDLLFDRAADIGLIYANPVHDYTEFVLEELGLGEYKEDN